MKFKQKTIRRIIAYDLNWRQLKTLVEVIQNNGVEFRTKDLNMRPDPVMIEELLELNNEQLDKYFRKVFWSWQG